VLEINEACASVAITSSPRMAIAATMVGRMVSNTFAGIAPGSAPSFIAAQLGRGHVALLLVMLPYPLATRFEADRPRVPS